MGAQLSLHDIFIHAKQSLTLVSVDKYCFVSKLLKGDMIINIYIIITSWSYINSGAEKMDLQLRALATLAEEKCLVPAPTWELKV